MFLGGSEKIMKKKVSFVLVFFILLIMLTGCSLFGDSDKITVKGKENKDIISDIKPYRIMNRKDRSFLGVERVEFAVYVQDPSVSIQTLEEYTGEIVEQYKNRYKGILVSFYEYEEEIKDFNNIPFAVGIWSPKGDFMESIVYDLYSEDDYKIVVKKNKLVYTPTEEDIEIYRQYLRNDKDLLKVFDERNIPDDDLNKMMEIEYRVYQMENRYKEVVER